MTSEEYRRQVSLGLIEVIDEEKDNDGHVKYARVTRDRYVERDAALVKRILGREVGGKQNILVLNDEAHHAYRIRKDEPDAEGGGSARRGGRSGRVLQGSDRLD